MVPETWLAERYYDIKQHGVPLTDLDGVQAVLDTLEETRMNEWCDYREEISDNTHDNRTSSR